MHDRARQGLVLALVAGFVGLLAWAAPRELAGWWALPGAPRWVGLAFWTVEVALVLFSAAMLLTLLAPRPRVPGPREGPAPDVDLFIPLRDENPYILDATLEAVGKLHGARVRVHVLDDSRDANTRAAVAHVAQRHGVQVLTRADRAGYKAGALNAALRVTDAPYVAVLDVDHVPEPDFLLHALAGFDDARVGGVQTRIAWRNGDRGLRALAALFQDQFYGVIQWASAHRGSAIFAGSAAVFRREALEDVGGFPEATLVEDFDLTVLLQCKNWALRFDDRVGARGLIPWTGHDIARQLWRWSHGTTRVLLLRARTILRAPLPLTDRLALLASAGGYTASWMLVLSGFLLGALALLGVGPSTDHAWLAVLAPASFFTVDAGTALVGASRGESRFGPARALWYHAVTLAYAPVVAASTLLALLGPRYHDEGRVAKDAGARRTYAPLLVATAAITTGLGLSLLAVAAKSSAVHLMWALELGIAFCLPFVLWSGAKFSAPEGRNVVAQAHRSREL